MTKWVCTVCGYVYEGENAPAEWHLLQNMNMAFTQKQ